MATITHSYTVNQALWYLTTSEGIKACTVVYLDALLDINATTLNYSVKLDTNEVVQVYEADLYATLSGVGSAMEAYEAILTA